MNIERNHLLIFALALLTAIVVLVITVEGADLGGRLGIVDALTGLLLLTGGAIAGAKVPGK